MKKINLYLDDLRDCPIGFNIARSFDEAKSYLDNFNIEILSLDHDLGIDDNGVLLKTGYDLVKYICENGIFIENIFLHTDNPVGRENMYQTLLSAQRRGFLNEEMKVYPFPYVKNKYSNTD